MGVELDVCLTAEVGVICTGDRAGPAELPRLDEEADETVGIVEFDLCSTSLFDPSGTEGTERRVKLGSLALAF
jgi:hypothetical protein